MVEKHKTNNRATNFIFNIESMVTGPIITNVVEVLVVGFAPHIRWTIQQKWTLWQTSMAFLGLVVAPQLLSGFLYALLNKATINKVYCDIRDK